MTHTDSPTDFASVIDLFGGAQAFGAAIGIQASHARTMKARNSIPADYWPGVVEAARRAAPPLDVTFELLSQLRGNLVQGRSVDAVQGHST